VDQLQPGDKVLAADPSSGALTYTTFTQNTHSLTTHMASFVAIRTSPSNKTLKLTHGHMLFRAQQGEVEGVKNKAGLGATAVNFLGKLLSKMVLPGKVAGHEVEVVPARLIKPGDVVFTSVEDVLGAFSGALESANSKNTQQQLHAETVIGVSIVKERGIYSPHTHAANLVVNDVLASCYTEESGTYGELFKLLPDSWSSLKHWITHRASLATVLGHLHGYVPEWFLPKVKEMEVKGGWSHLPYGQRWAVVSEGLVAAARKRLGLLAGEGIRGANDETVSEPQLLPLKDERLAVLHGTY
jgi:hypothetical protein